MSSRNSIKAPKQSVDKPSLKQRAAQMRDAAGRFIKRKPAQPNASQEPVAPLGTIAVPHGTHPDAYGLVVDENGLGLHAAPDARIIVEPVMPAKAGLAVFYMKGKPSPAIFDLARGFQPDHTAPFAPGSEVMPLIRVCEPVTGQIGHIRTDRVAAIHKVRGVSTSAEIIAQHRSAPAALTEMVECPEGMGTYVVDDAVAYPLVRPGETVVYDGMRREPTNGALCILQWNSGNRVAMQTERRPVGGWDEEGWFAHPVNRPSNSAMLERRLASGAPGLWYTSDGPYTEAQMRERIVGTVVGVLVPQQRATPAVATEAQPGLATATDTLAHVHPIDREHEQTNTAAAAKALTTAVSPALRTAILAHRDAFTASRSDPDDSDDNMDRHYAGIDRAADAIDAVLSSTLADLRAKLTYLLPRVLPDVNGRDHIARLLAFSDDLDRMCRAPVMSEDSTDPVFEAIRAHLAAWDAFGLTVNPTDKAWRRERGLDMSDEAMAAPEAAWKVAHEAEIAAWNAVFETRPTTLPGFVAVVRHAQQWASDHYGIDECLDADDIMAKIAADAERVMWAALDKRGDDRPNLSRVPVTELAAMSFEPVDRSATPCPVPSREDWIRDADMALPWLRLGWLYLSLDRDELADALLAEDDQQADDFGHNLNIAARNFDQLARFARAVLDRRMIGIAALAVREGAPDDIGGA
ncbi:hypothetical protein MKK88_08890 [Methylobacterium sp. E-005]|uniref:hypothetical protein n=1 Tax=Methylobacterium sp. E-005 TaxID=2836549 RepID=UPI001FB95793|nr:hypothetical protein [Methylobacterium sp. E-005]MCJ2086108.1 hypothetical protein [Methylobacterium sp. E-005]